MVCWICEKNGLYLSGNSQKSEYFLEFMVLYRLQLIEVLECGKESRKNNR